MQKNINKRDSKAQKQPKIGIIDFLLGFILATALSDWVVQPFLSSPNGSYGLKLVSWLGVTIIFLAIAAAVIFASVSLRYFIKK